MEPGTMDLSQNLKTGVEPGEEEAGTGKTNHCLKARMFTWKRLRFRGLEKNVCAKERSYRRLICYCGPVETLYNLYISIFIDII